MDPDGIPNGADVIWQPRFLAREGHEPITLALMPGHP